MIGISSWKARHENKITTVMKMLEKKLEVAERKMLKMNVWCNKNRQNQGTYNNSDHKSREDMKELRLQWFGQVRRREEVRVERRVVRMEARGRRSKGRLKRRWKDYVREDLRGNQLTVGG